ncbi:alpha/beta fold hydrolase [Erysipelothrix aquatica]|uniref:alpha/beta fold hydrolase n=1 Tax=Erysipelothrix aquatica TaxID=2683714 RepID=UPI001358AE9F|nr:alpha/beta hydrolase [Erysipelothrix aquatica]
MNKLSINRDGYTLNINDMRKDTDTPIFVIGSSIYYPKLFADSIYDATNFVFADHRGFSKSVVDGAPYNLDAIVEDIEAMRIILGIDKMHMLGHSGHGFMAMAYAKAYPDHVATLILSNLAPTNTVQRQQGSIQYFEDTASVERKTTFYRAWEAFQASVQDYESDRFSLMNIAMQAHSFYDYTFDGAYLWDDVVNNMAALDHLWGEAFAMFDTKSFLERYQKPVLLLLSPYDYLVAPTSLWKGIVFDNANITYGQFQASGHNPMLEEPIQYKKYLDLIM